MLVQSFIVNVWEHLTFIWSSKQVESLSSVCEKTFCQNVNSYIILNIKYSALHQESNLELKSLITVLKHTDNLKLLTANNRTKKTRLSQKKRKANQRARAE